MTKKIEKIYGIHSAMEILKTSPDRILNIWLQDSAKSKSIVLIHDAARPFVNDKMIQDCIKQLDSFDAVSTAVKSIDTIVSINNNIAFN